jgi:hypothetical protein
VNNLDMRRLEELIPMAEQRDLRILAQGGGWASLYYVARQGTLEQRNKLFEGLLAPNARKLVPQWHGRWGLLAWSLVEEIGVDHVKEISPYYALMRELDPTHESLVLHNSHAACVEDTALNRNPVSFHDTYPFFTDCRSGPCTTARSLAYYKKRLESFAATARERGIPMWVMMQAYGCPVTFDPDPPHFGYGDGCLVPTEAHLRVQVWLALAYGAKGLWWYPNRTGIPEGTAPLRNDWTSTFVWTEIGRIHAIVGRLADLLLKLETDREAKLAAVTGENLFVAWHRKREAAATGRFLIVVNEDLTEPRQVVVVPSDANHRAWDLTLGKPAEATTRVLQPGDGALFFVGPDTDRPQLGG